MRAVPNCWLLSASGFARGKSRPLCLPSGKQAEAMQARDTTWHASWSQELLLSGRGAEVCGETGSCGWSEAVKTAGTG